MIVGRCMNAFDEMNHTFLNLKAQWAAGRMDRDTFVRKVYELRLTDDQGTWWQIDPDSGGWLRWDGSTWIRSKPPGFERSDPRLKEARYLCPNCKTPLSPGIRFCTACGNPLKPEEPHRRSFTDTDTLHTEMLCANCGALVPKGVAHCTSCGVPFRPAGVRVSMSAGSSPAGTRGKDANLQKPSEKRQKRWDWIAIIGCFVMAACWFFYSSLRTDPDYASCGAMVGLPILIRIFRSHIDKVLVNIPGLQTLRQRTPPVARIGVSMAMPLFFSTVLYIQNIRNFPLMFLTLVLSVAVSYALLRQPSRTGH